MINHIADIARNITCQYLWQFKMFYQESSRNLVPGRIKMHDIILFLMQIGAFQFPITTVRTIILKAGFLFIAVYFRLKITPFPGWHKNLVCRKRIRPGLRRLGLFRLSSFGRKPFPHSLRKGQAAAASHRRKAAHVPLPHGLPRRRSFQRPQYPSA